MAVLVAATSVGRAPSGVRPSRAEPGYGRSLPPTPSAVAPAARRPGHVLLCKSSASAEQWGFHAYGRYAQIEPWVYADNGRLIDREAMRFDPDERALEAISCVTSLVSEYRGAPEPRTISEIDTEKVFAQQIAGMRVDGSWNIGYMRDNVGDSFAYGIAPVPAGPQGDRSQDNIAVGKLPAYRELAEDPSFPEQNQQPAEKSIPIDLAERDAITSFTKSWSEWRGNGPGRREY